MTSPWVQVERIAMWTLSLAFGVQALFYLDPIVYFTDMPSYFQSILLWLFRDLNIATWVYAICRNWIVTLVSSLLSFLLLRSTSKGSMEGRWEAIGPFSVIAVVFAYHMYLSVGAKSLFAYLNINPTPMVWMLLSMVAVYFVSCLAMNGWVWRAYNWIVQRSSSGRIERHGSSAQAGLVRYLIEFLGACFWILYLITVSLGMTPRDWNLWNGWPLVMISLSSLMFILLTFGFGEILGLSHAGKPITLKRFHNWWALSPSIIVAFVLTMQARLGTFDQQALFWTFIFSYSLSFGSALAVLAVREPLLDAVKRKQWYTSMKVEEREDNYTRSVKETRTLHERLAFCTLSLSLYQL